MPLIPQSRATAFQNFLAFTSSSSTRRLSRAVNSFRFILHQQNQSALQHTTASYCYWQYRVLISHRSTTTRLALDRRRSARAIFRSSRRQNEARPETIPDRDSAPTIAYQHPARSTRLSLALSAAQPEVSALAETGLRLKILSRSRPALVEHARRNTHLGQLF